MPGNIIEQILLEAKLPAIEDLKVIRDYQHGFTKDKSCLMAFCDGITASTEKGRTTDEICLNFTKAWDMVPSNSNNSTILICLTGRNSNRVIFHLKSSITWLYMISVPQIWK